MLLVALTTTCRTRADPLAENLALRRQIAKPATVIAWYREDWRLVGALLSRKMGGRPPIPLEVRELICRMSHENRLRGSPRIQAELTKLRFHVAKSTVQKYMVRRKKPALVHRSGS